MPDALPGVGGILGATLGLFGALGNNKAVKRARDRAIAQETVRTSIEQDRNAKRTRTVEGGRLVNLGERGTFGRSSMQAVLSDLNQGLTNEEALELEKFFNIANIRSQASRSMQNPFTSAISSGISGFQFGKELNEYLG